jgi:hypothetical protein
LLLRFPREEYMSSEYSKKWPHCYTWLHPQWLEPRPRNWFLEVLITLLQLKLPPLEKPKLERGLLKCRRKHWEAQPLQHF